MTGTDIHCPGCDEYDSDAPDNRCAGVPEDELVQANVPTTPVVNHRRDFAPVRRYVVKSFDYAASAEHVLHVVAFTAPDALTQAELLNKRRLRPTPGIGGILYQAQYGGLAITSVEPYQLELHGQWQP